MENLGFLEKLEYWVLNNLYIGVLEKLVYLVFQKTLGNVVWMGFIWFVTL